MFLTTAAPLELVDIEIAQMEDLTNMRDAKRVDVVQAVSERGRGQPAKVAESEAGRWHELAPWDDQFR